MENKPRSGNPGESIAGRSVDRRDFITVAAAGLGGAALYLTGCGGDSPTGGNGGNGGSNGGGGPQADVVIEMENIAFVAPDGGDAVTIQLGQTVGWVNRDGVAHTATSNEEPAGGTAFDSGLLSNAETFVFEPNVVGTWVYFCEVHPAQMAGATIVVE
ncbi:MAG: hypothetical protein P8Y10_14090 [Gemmatimonadales bacterium]|jgi:plastocyanin